MVRAFEAERAKDERKKQTKRRMATKKVPPPPADGSAADAEPLQCGFELGMRPERILGATRRSGELMFLLKFAERSRSEMVMAQQANEICPGLVIAFYEARVTWDLEGYPGGQVAPNFL